MSQRLFAMLLTTAVIATSVIAQSSHQAGSQIDRDALLEIHDATPPRISTIFPAVDERIVDSTGVHILEIGLTERVYAVEGAVRVWGVTSGDIPIVNQYFDPQTNLFHIELEQRILADVLTVALDYTIRDAAGNRLDGEVAAPRSPQLPSGDGIEGGKAVFRYEILQGDANRDGRVDQDDASLIIDALGSTIGSPGYNPLADLNSDGAVNVVDVAIWSAGLGGELPVLDGVPPTVTGFDPSPEVPLDEYLSQIRVHFSEPIAPGYIDPHDFFVIDSRGKLHIPAFVLIENDDMDAVFGFDEPIGCSRFTVNLGSGIPDATGTLLELPNPQPVFDALFPPPSPTIDAHLDITSDQSAILTGLAPRGVTIEVAGPGGMATAQVTDGTYTIQAPLRANTANTLYVTSISSCGGRSAPRATQVVMDTQVPNIYIDFPVNGSDIEADATDVAGRVADTLSGFEGLSVLVNGQAADVDVGIGTNGTFFLPSFPLNQDGPTTITAIATDVLGNTHQRSITVHRREIPPEAPRMQLTSGGGQTGMATVFLPTPMTVQVLSGAGVPVEGKVVTFTVQRSDGLLATALSGAPHVRSLQAITDSQGYARVFWRLGTDAGCGNNRLAVTSRDIAGSIVVCASAQPRPAFQINVGAGNNQRTEAGAPAPRPLRVFVSDGCNGIAGLPIEFTVVTGNGQFTNGESSVTVLTTQTGHAQVGFTLGQTAGQNRVRATFANNPNAPVEFVLTGIEREDEQDTTFSGLVLDNASQPIEGVAVGLVVNGVQVGSTITDIEGQFSFSGIPGSGLTELSIDGTGATGIGGPKNYQPVEPLSFPGLHFETLTVANAENSLGMPILLPRLNPANVRTYSTTEPTILESEGMDGLRMVIEPGSMTMPDGTPAANGQILALNQVHHDDVPMPMPDGAAPPFAWTVYPPEATFDPPIRIEYPNMSGLAPGSIAYFLSFDHDTGKFEIVSSGSVSSDGSTITTDPGSGLTVSGWGCNCPPYSITAECKKCEPMINGCGSETPLFDIPGTDISGPNSLGVPDHWVVGSNATVVDVTIACNNHDLCYAECDASRNQCDIDLRDELLGMCYAQCVDSGSSGLSCAYDCTILSYIYYWFVDLSAQGAFDDAQSDLHANGCCEEHPNSSPHKPPKRINDPPYIDGDFDLLPDDWEIKMGLNPNDPSDALIDLDEDGLFNLMEYIAKTDPLSPDTDGNGIDDLHDFQSLQNTPEVSLDDKWRLEIASQVIQASQFGRFTIPNIAAPDQFGPGGPGTSPDFLSDDFVRVTGTAMIDGKTWYAYSTPFQFSQGQTYIVDDLVITDTPPPFPQAVHVSLPSGSSSVLEPNQTLQLVAIALLSDGSETDVTARSQLTVYRTSNASVATVGPNGLITAHGIGVAFITAVNESATGVLRIEVVDDPQPTTVIGVAYLPNGDPAIGAMVEVVGQGVTAFVDASGAYRIESVATALGDLSLALTLGDYFGVVTGIEPSNGELTDAGLTTLQLPPNTAGSDFLVVFQRNFNFNSAQINPQLFIAASSEAAVGEVSIPGLSFSQQFTVPMAGLISVPLPVQVLVSSNDGTSNLSVRVSASADIVVYGLNQRDSSTDAFTGLPIGTFGTEYMVLSYPSLNANNNSSQFAIVASEDGTTVEITTRVSAYSAVAGIPYTVQLNSGDVYQLRGDDSGDDLTGTRICSDKPVGLFAGNSCANVPVNISFCDHLTQQIPPLTAWGQETITTSLATRSGGDTIRVLAALDDTSLLITFEDGTSQAMSLNAGEFGEAILEGRSIFQADKPILVAQYANGGDYDGALGDPFMMIVPPLEQHLTSYTFSTPASGFSDNFVNVIALSSQVFGDGVVLDGSVVAPSMFTPIAGTDYSTARLAIAAGVHRVSAGTPIGISVYGFNSDNSYGYPGGLALKVIEQSERNTRAENARVAIHNFSRSPNTARHLVKRHDASNVNDFAAELSTLQPAMPTTLRLSHQGEQRSVIPSDSELHENMHLSDTPWDARQSTLNFDYKGMKRRATIGIDSLRILTPEEVDELPWRQHREEDFPIQNSAGQRAETRQGPEGEQRVFFVDEDESAQILPTLGGVAAYASDINSLGDIIGSSQTSCGTMEGFVWQYDQGSIESIGTLGGQNSAAMNWYTSWALLGQAENSVLQTCAVLWIPNAGLIDLNTLLHPGAQVHLTSPMHVKSDGTIYIEAIDQQRHIKVTEMKLRAHQSLVGDLDGNAIVDQADLLTLLDFISNADAKADLNADGILSAHDIRYLLEAIGQQQRDIIP